jgi:hypothetical protein
VWRRVAAEQTRMERERAGNVEDALERVRRLHREVQYPRHDYGCCIECTNEDPEPYPCKTVRALEGNL